MAIAHKLPSGNYRVQVFDGKDERGKLRRTSFTASTAKEAELLALEYQLGRKRLNKPENMTVGEAIDRYIESKDAVLSPSTIRMYKAIRRIRLQEIINLPLSKITPEAVQREINREAKKYSPKTIRNMHGLLSATIKSYCPDLILRTTLPQKEKPNIYIPNENDIDLILNEIPDTEMELPVMFAACLGLRRSEVCGLTWDNVDFGKGVITVKQAKVIDSENEFIIKVPKTYAGNRTLKMPQILIDALKKNPDKTGFLVNINPNVITNRFSDILAKLNIPHFRFHDLRHYYASLMVMLGVPDIYAMNRMGHATANMLKTVYQHTFDNEMNRIDNVINDHFNMKIRKK